MFAFASLVCLFTPQVLEVTPHPAEAGAPVRVFVASSQGAAAGVSVQVRLPDGSERALGPTGADGSLQCAWSLVGDYAYSADVDGVRLLAPHVVMAVRARWPLAIVCVPLGLAFLWRNWPRKRSLT